MNRKLVIVFRIKWWEMDFGLVWRLDLVIAWSELVISCLEISVSGFEIKMDVVAGKMDDVGGRVCVMPFCVIWVTCWATARNVSATVADAYLVATTAAAKNMTLVTYEKSNPNSKARVLIPDACEAVGANYCDLNAVLRGMGVVI